MKNKKTKQIIQNLNRQKILAKCNKKNESWKHYHTLKKRQKKMICCKHKNLFWIFNLEICNFDENNQVVNSLRI
jgi:hypothetical protein